MNKIKLLAALLLLNVGLASALRLDVNGLEAISDDSFVSLTLIDENAAHTVVIEARQDQQTGVITITAHYDQNTTIYATVQAGQREVFVNPATGTAFNVTVS